MRPILFAALSVWAAGLQWVGAQTTFGTVVLPVTQGGINFLTGGAADLVLDDARGRLYLVNSGQRRVEVYSLTQRRFLGVIQTDLFPISAALSRSGQFLYVTCHEAPSLNIIDLDSLTLVRSANLPAKPEGVAVGADERVLITTIGTGANNVANTLLSFDPTPNAAGALREVIFTPPPPPSPLLPPPAGRPALAARTNLIASHDGRRIFGFNAISNTQRALFVYEVESGIVLRSRIVNGASSVLSVSPDGTKFMAGLRLFDTETLQVLAQQDAANLPYGLPAGANFNLQQNQGGSVFSPDGQTLYTALNFAPVQTPPAGANVSQLLYNDPDNLLTSMGLKLPENLAGNMVISADGATIYAISESGFVILPVGRLFQDYAIAVPSVPSILLAGDQCASTGALQTSRLEVRNTGRGSLSATAQLVTTGAAAQQTAPIVRTAPPQSGVAIDFNYNSFNNRAIGTVTPHDYQIAAPAAVNIPAQVRIFQNSRDTEARAQIEPMAMGVSAAQAVTDMVLDTARQRLYLANSGLNRVEIFDLRERVYRTPLKVGQFPRSLALTPDGSMLYVANSGGESISIIDVDRLAVVGQVRFPALPFNSTVAIVTPTAIAATERGLQIVMSNGSLWRLVGDEAVPRPVSPIIGANTVPAPRAMAATPNGEFAILLAGNGTAYLYDALADEYVQSRAVVQAPIQGYFGPIAAGPGGQYFLVNGMLLNRSLTTVSTVATGGRPVAAVAPAGATTYARFSQPVRANANVLVTDPPTVEIVDINSGVVRASFTAVEGPLAVQTGTTRVNIDGRSMAIDPEGTAAYILTASGLSIVPLQAPDTGARPTINRNGVVNLASYLPQISPNGLISIFGSNLGRAESSSTSPLPRTLGGMCVTINNNSIPLLFTSPGQINVQVPPELAVNRHNLVVRSLDNKLSSAVTAITLSRYSPAVLVDDSGQAAIFHADGRPVNRDNPASRDDRLTLYAVGMGPVTGTTISAGVPAPDSPLAETGEVKVYFDNPSIRESEIAVEWSGLVPGFVGLYQVNLYVPWYRRRGDALPVTVRIGGVSSPTSGPAVPRIRVN